MRWMLWFGLAACGAADSDGLTAEDCSSDEVFTTECAECGPTDGCLESRAVCAPTCMIDLGSCDDQGGMCIGGACLHNVCG